jgi:tRNA C32,U32 (ribose-2'-O)-methylase TrmJ
MSGPCFKGKFMEPATAQMVYQFSGLETILISLLVAVISCVMLFWRMSKQYVTHDQCRQNHAGTEKDDAQIKELLEKMEQKMDQQYRSVDNKNELMFRMLRAVISYLDLPPEKRTEILNMRPGNNGS